MPVVGFRYLGRGKRYSDNTDRVHEHTLTGRVTVNSLLDDGFLIGQSLLVPQLFSVHPWQPDARLKSRSIEKESKTKWTWLVTLNYSTEQDEENEESENPTDDPPQVSITTVKGTKIIEKDITGKAILNSLGFSPQNPLEIRQSTSVLRVIRNEDVLPERNEWLDKINSEPFAGGDPGTVICSLLDAERAYRNGTYYYKVTYEFEDDPDGWQPSLLNQSLYVKDGGNLVRAKDADGRDLAEPVPITEAGVQIDADDLPDSAVFLDFEGYEEVDFNELELPV